MGCERAPAPDVAPEFETAMGTERSGWSAAGTASRAAHAGVEPRREEHVLTRVEALGAGGDDLRHEIGADAHMLDSHDVDGVIEVIDHSLQRGLPLIDRQGGWP